MRTLLLVVLCGLATGVPGPEEQRAAPASVRYQPPNDGRSDIFTDVVVNRTDQGRTYEYEINLTFSREFDQKYVGLAVYGTKVAGNAAVDRVPKGVLQNLKGEYLPGQRIVIPLKLPKIYTNVKDGWTLRVCAQLADGRCFPSRNLLAGTD
jgi:hypothetical protein